LAQGLSTYETTLDAIAFNQQFEAAKPRLLKGYEAGMQIAKAVAGLVPSVLRQDSPVVKAEGVRAEKLLRRIGSGEQFAIPVTPIAPIRSAPKEPQFQVDADTAHALYLARKILEYDAKQLGIQADLNGSTLSSRLEAIQRQAAAQIVRPSLEKQALLRFRNQINSSLDQTNVQISKINQAGDRVKSGGVEVYLQMERTGNKPAVTKGRDQTEEVSQAAFKAVTAGLSDREREARRRNEAIISQETLRKPLETPTQR